MPLTVPSTIFPTEERFVNVIREATPGTVPATSGTTFPLVNLEPEDKPLWLLDESLRGGMGDIYDMLQGPEYAEVTIPETPVYVDMIGHPLYNTFGDYTQSAPATTPNTTTTGSANIPGSTTLNVSSGTSFTVGMQIQVYVSGSSGPAEIVKVLSGAAGSITLDPTTPLRLNHVAGATVTNTTVAAGTYSHAFSLLTSGFIGTNNFLNFGQPPSHTWTDRTQVPLISSNPGGARQYADACFQTLVLTGNAEKLLAWNGAFSSYVGQLATVPPAASVSSVRAIPDFTTTVQLATTGALAPVYNIMEWQLTFSRQLKVFFTNDGSQNPFVIGRGKLGVSGKLTFSPATDESALLFMLNNTQPQLQILTTNNLPTNNPLYQAVQIDVLFADFDTSKINSSDVLFGYDVTFKSHHTAQTRNSVTATGWSGGFSACKVTVNNAVPIF
jgi:hypothetical protein